MPAMKHCLLCNDHHRQSMHGKVLLAFLHVPDLGINLFGKNPRKGVPPQLRIPESTPTNSLAHELSNVSRWLVFPSAGWVFSDGSRIPWGAPLTWERSTNSIF